MNDWYRVLDEGTEIRVEFVPSTNRFWSPDILRQNPLPVNNVQGREVILTGSGAVWMYAHAAAVFRAGGARKISVQTPNKPGSSNDLDGCESLLILAGEEEGKGALLVVRLRTSPPLSLAAIDRLVEPRLEELSRLRTGELVLSGRATVDIYARATRTAVESGVRKITCWSARDGLVVVYDPEGGQQGYRISRPDWLARAMPRPVWPLVLGVTGDPNVGKSVFSGVLDWYRDRVGYDGWKLDCDGQSPTPSWYLSLVREETAAKMREEIKRSWTPEMEATIAEQLRLGRDLFSVLIADLPGGNHQTMPPQRIPPGRERIFREVDAMVLLDREDGSSEAEWRKALKPHGLEGRIAAVLNSCNPQDSPSLHVYKDGDLWRGEVRGLDRSREARDLGEAFREGLDQLWSALLASARRRSAHG